jgi:hypothetical protein
VPATAVAAAVKISVPLLEAGTETPVNVHGNVPLSPAVGVVAGDSVPPVVFR